MRVATTKENTLSRIKASHQPQYQANSAPKHRGKARPEEHRFRANVTRLGSKSANKVKFTLTQINIVLGAA